MRVIARVFTRIAERYLPDAFVFLVVLTLIVFALGIAAGSSPREVLGYWGDGYFEILEFTAQSTLMLVTGYALANTPPVHRALRWFTRLPRNEVQIIVLTVLVMMVCSWISWGFGLIAGAIVAREMGIVHRGKVDYPLLVAGTYAGFVVWHAGYGGSIPQLIATSDHFLVDDLGVIPVSETIFSVQTLVIVALLLVVVPLTMVMMRPPAEERIDLPESVLLEQEEELARVGSFASNRATGGGSEADPASTAGGASTAVRGAEQTSSKPVLAERLETSRAVTLGFGLLGLLYLISYYAGGGLLDINMVIFSFLVAGLLLMPNVRVYLEHLMGGAKAAYGIILQFPFYGALMGIMTGTGLVTILANVFVDISSADTLPFWSFISGGIVNMFVPSGGGQWAVQGPVMVEAAGQLGASQAETAMGVAWGDAWTNLIQPFWAIPLLAIAGLGIRQIMGYTAVVLIVTGVVIGGGLLIL